MVKVLIPVEPSSIPSEVNQLIDQRTAAKQSRDYTLADQIRLQIEKLGYSVNDKSDGTVQILKLGDAGQPPSAHYLILFGSGEIAPSSVDIYRKTFLTLGKRDLTISLVTTPAGFQPNVDLVYGEIKDFLLASLPDFNLNVQIIYANTQTDCNNPELVAKLGGSDIIFLGPGSPTYAVKQLKKTLLLSKIIDQVKNRSTLILASAATISFSRYALPVYEIYKVGEDLHWVDGLDVYRDIWQDATIIPHFNNREGGEGLDTTYCYIGESRAKKLLATLPPSHQVIGIDEHTALVIDLDGNTQEVRGKGQTHRVE